MFKTEMVYGSKLNLIDTLVDQKYYVSIYTVLRYSQEHRKMLLYFELYKRTYIVKQSPTAHLRSHTGCKNNDVNVKTTPAMSIYLESFTKLFSSKILRGKMTNIRRISVECIHNYLDLIKIYSLRNTNHEVTTEHDCGVTCEETMITTHYRNGVLLLWENFMVYIYNATRMNKTELALVS
ncbi:hypothetical protein AGLY_009837 [Aphis glycines]|uniref:Uncharacterized protein n=1 Tax=Aphis glycines TaxID=307491 RepID=A0A6G0THU7_APHGL|nr:hypothetical protein AGLY_009837 [Aphis glycines]